MLTYDELAKKKEYLKEQQQTLAKEFESKTESIAIGIKRTQKLLDNYERYPTTVANGYQYINNFYYESPSTVINLIDFAIKEIRKGYLSDIQRKEEKFIAGYKPRSGSTSNFIIHRDDLIASVEMVAAIVFTDEFHELPIVKSEDTVAILAYLNHKRKEIEEGLKEGAKG
ncbi:hypothetical protein K9131_001777 [Listeria monocytogenes]|nr:hypothetical protein [Listeria monocytogenes]